MPSLGVELGAPGPAHQSLIPDGIRAGIAGTLAARGRPVPATLSVSQFARAVDLAARSPAATQMRAVSLAARPVVSPITGDLKAPKGGELLGWMRIKGTQELAPEVLRGSCSAAEVHQGPVGDCWALSAIGAIAEVAPEQLRDRLRFEDGRVEVRMSTPGGPDRHHVMDTSVYWQRRNVGGAAVTEPLAAHRSGQAMGIVMLEKAVALELPGGLGELNRGHPPTVTAKVMEWFTGRPATVVAGRLGPVPTVDSLSAEHLHDVLSHAGASAQPVETAFVADLEARGDLVDLFDRYNVINNHAYWMRSYDPAGRTIQLANPHGHNHPLPIPLEDWRRMARDLVVGDVRRTRDDA